MSAIPPKPLNAARLVCETCVMALQELFRATGEGPITGDDVVSGLTDTMAVFLGKAPSCATIRGRKQMVERFGRALNERIMLVQQAQAATGLVAGAPVSKLPH